MLTKVLNLFQAGHPLGPPAASSLAILADKTGDRVLSKANYATVKVSVREHVYSTPYHPIHLRPSDVLTGLPPLPFFTFYLGRPFISKNYSTFFSPRLFRDVNPRNDQSNSSTSLLSDR